MYAPLDLHDRVMHPINYMIHKNEAETLIQSHFDDGGVKLIRKIAH